MNSEEYFYSERFEISPIFTTVTGNVIRKKSVYGTRESRKTAKHIDDLYVVYKYSVIILGSRGDGGQSVQEGHEEILADLQLTKCVLPLMRWEQPTPSFQPKKKGTVWIASGYYPDVHELPPIKIRHERCFGRDGAVILVKKWIPQEDTFLGGHEKFKDEEIISKLEGEERNSLLLLTESGSLIMVKEFSCEVVREKFSGRSNREEQKVVKGASDRWWEDEDGLESQID